MSMSGDGGTPPWPPAVDPAALIETPKPDLAIGTPEPATPGPTLPLLPAVALPPPLPPGALFDVGSQQADPSAGPLLNMSSFPRAAAVIAALPDDLAITPTPLPAAVPPVPSTTVSPGDSGELAAEDVEIVDGSVSEAGGERTPPPLPPEEIRRSLRMTPPAVPTIEVASRMRPTPPPLPAVAQAAVLAGGPPPVPVASDPAPGQPPLLPPGAAWSEALSQRPKKKRLKPWFEEVFDEDYLRTLPFMTPDQTLREVAFIKDALNPPPDGQILDVGCGYGRHAIELGQRGLHVTGIDLSLPLLIRAADESQRRALNVNFVHADMREMAFDGQFDGAYCALTTFGYFDEETNLRVATSIFRALKPGGRFLMDTLNRDYIVHELPTRVWWEGDGCVVLEEVDFNFHTSRVTVRRSSVFQDGRQVEHEISIRAYSLHELGKLMRQAGFRVLEVSGSLATKGHFFGATSRNILMICERPAG